MLYLDLTWKFVFFLSQIFPQIFPEMQSKLSEKCGKSKRHETFPSRGINTSQRRGTSIGCLWQHVCSQQFQTWSKGQKIRPDGRFVLLFSSLTISFNYWTTHFTFHPLHSSLPPFTSYFHFGSSRTFRSSVRENCFLTHPVSLIHSHLSPLIVLTHSHQLFLSFPPPILRSFVTFDTITSISLPSSSLYLHLSTLLLYLQHTLDK